MGINYSGQIGKKITTSGHKRMCIPVARIMYIQSHGDLATLFLNNKSQVSDLKTLKEFENELSNMGFIRISRETLINGKYITNVNTNCGKSVVYLGDITLNISRRRLHFVKKQL
jgi:DNA-binding LytR/AlgR family response regulator